MRREDLEALGANLKLDIESVRTELHSTRTELSSEIAGVRTELKSEIDTLRADMVVWKDDVQRSFDVGVETIRADIKAFGELNEARYEEIRRELGLKKI